MSKRDPLNPQKCAELLAALAAPERLKIVRFLSAGPHNVTEIAEMLDVAAVNVSHHLNVLQVSGVVNGERKVQFVLSWIPLDVDGEDVQARAPENSCGPSLC